MLLTITKEPEECYINIYLLCSDKLECALPGYFIQSVKADKHQTSLLLSLVLLKQASTHGAYKKDYASHFILFKWIHFSIEVLV